MASPEIQALDLQITNMRSQIAAVRGRIPQEVDAFRHKLEDSAGELEQKVQELEDAKNKMREAEEAPDNAGQ